MSSRESEISAAKRILHDAMEHLERAEESQQEQTGLEERTSKGIPVKLIKSPVGYRSMSAAAEQRRLCGHDKHRKTGQHRKFGAGSREEASTRKILSHQTSITSNRQVWTFTFVCLADHQRNTPPSFEEKMKLSRGRVGERRVSIGQTDDSLEHNAVLDNLPCTGTHWV